MQIPDNNPEVVAAACGAAGAAVSLQWIHGLAWWQKLLMIVTGVFLAVMFGPPIAEYMDLSGRWAAGVAALLGLLGWSLVGKAIATIQAADVWPLFADIIRRWLGRG